MEDYYLSISYTEKGKPYFFSTTDTSLVVGDYVLVESIKGLELGIVREAPKSSKLYKNQLNLKPIISKATKEDIIIYQKNKEDAKNVIDFATEQISDLRLGMKIINADYSLNRDKLSISYVSENRVDFRDLLKILANRFKTRIELRQIGSREKAKFVGGIGTCGLPLCCSTFLNEFDGISIARAKNQMLSLNISKLSGHCGKLLCCLKYEDENYSEAKKDFPSIGSRFTNDKGASYYRLNSYNVISRSLRLDNNEGSITIGYDEFKAKWKSYDQK